MEEETVETVLDAVQTHEFRHGLAKVVIGTVAGYLTSKLAEHAYDCALKAIREKRLAANLSA